MKKLFQYALFISVLFVSCLFAQTELTVDNIFNKRKFGQEYFRQVKWQKNTSNYIKLQKSENIKFGYDLVAFNPVTEEKKNYC